MSEPPTAPSQTPPHAPAALDAAPVIPRLAIVGLALCAGASGMSMRVADALLPRLAGQFSIPLGEAAQVITAFAVAYGIAQLVFGPTGDRHGKYRVIGWAAFASAATSLLCALAFDHASLVIARLFAGATAAAVIPLSMAWIGDVIPYQQRQAVLARFLTGQMIGFSAGVWFGGFAAEHLDWRTPFVVIALVFLAVACLLQVMRRRLPPGADRAQPGSGPALARMVGEFRAVLALPWARAVLLTVFLEGAAFFGPFAFIASHLHLRFGLSLSTAGALVMLYGVGGITFAAVARVLVRRLGERLLVGLGAALMAASMLAIAFAPHWWWAMPACTLLGLGFYMMHNTLQVNATQMAPQRRGAAVSGFAACLFLGQSAGVAAAGALVARIGIGALIATGALGLLAVAWNHDRLGRSLRPVHAPAL